MTVIMLHNICSNDSPNKDHPAYDSRSSIEALPKEYVLTFDGVYKNVYDNWDILKGRNVILFVMGNYVGKDNSFNIGPGHRKKPPEIMADWNQIMEMVCDGAELGWHTLSHQDLTRLGNTDEIYAEILPPFPMENFAYPFGRFDNYIIRAVRLAGFKKGYAVQNGDDTNYQIKRKAIRWL